MSVFQLIQEEFPSNLVSTQRLHDRVSKFYSKTEIRLKMNGILFGRNQ
ncbi:Uncharacterized protein XB16_2245 [Leptospira santarosai]|uniref:Uncharacterized protein n=1 Tax=Leptospira santarosai TaxID=28183 RepID=A0A2P1QUL3_9LEPT|nr:Uncharacterized protein XB16_2245 [Leptospira santarosai]